MCALCALAFTVEYSVFGFWSCYMTCPWNNFDLHRKINWENIYKQWFDIGTAFIWSWGNTGSNSCWVMMICVVQIFKILWLNVVPTWTCWCNDDNLGNHVDKMQSFLRWLAHTNASTRHLSIIKNCFLWNPK